MSQDNIVDITSVLAAEQHTPEAVSVRVLTPSESIARTAAPMVARRLYPDREFGRVLHMEWTGKDWECAVEVTS